MYQKCASQDWVQMILWLQGDVHGHWPRSSDSPLLPRRARSYLDPAQGSSVLLALSLSLFASIQRCTSVIFKSEQLCTWHWKYSWMSSAYACLTSCTKTTSARSAMYKINKWGPRTERGAQSKGWQPQPTSYQHTRPECSVRYKRNHWRTTPQIPNWQSNQSIWRSGSTQQWGQVSTEQ